MATMSDKPLGPDWWQASDGTWHPPELHPSMQGQTPSVAQISDPSSLTPAPVTTAPPAGAAQVTPIAPLPSTDTVPQVGPVAQVAPLAPLAPLAPVVPVAQVAPVAQVVPGAADPTLAAVAPIVTSPADAPVATVEMPGFGPVPPQPVPSLADVQAHPSWSGESDLRPGSGPMFPDMFQQAVADSQLVSAVAVNYGDGELQSGYDVLPQPGINDPQLVESSPFRMPAEVGAFTGASAKKRRWHH
jgi:hypothetical protein